MRSFFAVMLMLVAIRVAQASEEVAQSFTLDGRLYSDAAATLPLADNVSFKVQILNPAQTCIVYEETQNVNTSTSSGYYTLHVGEAQVGIKRSSGDSGNTFASIFSNTIASIPGKLVADGITPCSYSPASGHSRYLKVTVVPSDNIPRTTTTNMVLDAVPTALIAERAESLQGFGPSSFLKVNSVGAQVLSQTNLESIFTVTNFTNLTNLLAIPAANVIRTNSNGSVAVPSVAGTPASLVAGQFWFDSNVNKLKYYDGTTSQVVGTATGSVTSVASGTGLVGGPITSSGTLAVDVGTAAGQIVQVQTGGKLPALDGSNLSNLSTAGIAAGGGFVNGGNSLGAAATLGTNDGFSLNFETGNTTQMTILTSGNVGVGNSTPLEKLSVTGAMVLNNTGVAAPTTLSGNVTAVVTTLPVVATAGYPTSGTLMIDKEIVTYTGVTPTSFTGVVRGAGGTTADFHYGSIAVHSTAFSIVNGANVAFAVKSDGSLQAVDGNAAGAKSIALGGSADGFSAVSMGHYSTGSGYESVAIGEHAATYGDSAVALGSSVRASGSHSMALGANTKTGSNYGGSGGDYSMAIGLGAPAGTQPIVTGTNSLGIFMGDQSGANLAANSVMALIGGKFGIGTMTPTASLHLAAGTAAAGTSPLKLTAGVNLTSPEAGAIEFDGTDLFFTNSVPTRRTIATAVGGATSSVNYISSTGDITLAPAASTGAVLVNSGTSSLGTSSGALVVTGGVGISENLNVGGSYSMAGTGTHTQTYSGTGTAATISANSLTSGSILNLTSNSTAAAGGNTGLNIAISGANATSGITRYGIQSAVTATGTSSINVGASFSASGATNNYGLLVPNGNVGIGTTSPSYSLDIATTDKGSTLRVMNTNSTSARYPAVASVNYMGTAGSGNPILEFINNRGNSTTSAPVQSGDLLGAFAARGSTNASHSNALGGQILFYATENWSSSANGGAIAFTTTSKTTTGPVERMRIDDSGNVGIGTTAPWLAKLQVDEGAIGSYGVTTNPGFKSWSNDASFPGGMTFTQARAGGYVQSGDLFGGIDGRNKDNVTSAGFRLYASQNHSATAAGGFLSFLTTPDNSTALAERMRIDQNGKVGIGTTSPAESLEVYKSQDATTWVKVNNPSNSAWAGAGLAIHNDVGEIGELFAGSNIYGNPQFASRVNFNSNAANSSGVDIVAQKATADIRLYTGGAATTNERLRIDSSGKVGIGTKSPAYALDVVGTVNGSDFFAQQYGAAVYPQVNAVAVSTNGNAQWITSRARGTSTWLSVQDGDTIGQFSNRAWNGTLSEDTAGINFTVDGTDVTGAGNHIGGRIDFVTRGTSFTSQFGNGINAMTIRNSGNVGIGTTSPTYTLDLKPNNDSTDIWRASATAANGGNYYYIDRWGNLGHGTQGAVIGFDTNVTRAAYSSGASDVYITTDISGAGTHNIILKPHNGNVGIGTTTPQTAFQVEGVISPATNNSYSLGNASYRFTEVYATNGTINVSDRREKRDVKTTDLGLDFITKLRPVSYRWNSGLDDDIHYGVIAQETEKALRDSGKIESTSIVAHDKETDRYGVRYTELISPLIKAVQELKAENLKLKQENDAIKVYLCSKDKAAPICK